jgi:hypothetical protein
MRTAIYWILVFLGLVTTVALAMLIINWSINTHL